MAEREEEWLTAKEAAEFLGVSRRTIQDYVQQRKIQAYRSNIRGRLLFRRQDLEEFKRPRPIGGPPKGEESRRAA
jgi:excisionase family DNA binding protein